MSILGDLFGGDKKKDKKGGGNFFENTYNNVKREQERFFKKLSGGKSQEDVLFGEKKGGRKGGFVPLDPRYEGLLERSIPLRQQQIDMRKKELGRIGSLLDKKFDPADEAKRLTRLRTGEITRGLGQMQEDQLRRQQQLAAQRGLGRSSIGIGQALGLQRDVAEKLAQQRASIGQMRPMLERQLANEELQRRMGAFQRLGGAFANVPLQREYIMPIKAQRRGGIADLLGRGLGAVVGAKAGGPQGAMIGSQLGGVAAEFGRSQAS